MNEGKKERKNKLTIRTEQFTVVSTTNIGETYIYFCFVGVCNIFILLIIHNTLILYHVHTRTHCIVVTNIIGSVCWTFGLMGKIMGGCLAGVAVFNTYILCRYPSYRKIREKVAEEEDKRIEARISKEVKQQTIKQMTKSAMGKQLVIQNVQIQ